LHATVKFAAGETPIRSVLIVDVDRRSPSEVALRLAETFARGGDSCVYLDANVRGTDRAPGLLELAAGTADTATLLQPGTVAELSQLRPGALDDPDLLSGDGVGRVVEALLSDHAYLIAGCAVLPQFGDALALAPRMDAVILTVTSGVTRRPRAIEARDALERVGGRLLGVVLIEPERRRFW
jgi:non-specific protein-tyrosine kinase